MKKIGIDARLYFQTGVGVYLRNLIHYLQDMTPDDIVFNVYFLKNEIDMVEFKNPRFYKVATESRWHSFSEQTLFMNQLYRDRLDLMHFTYFSYPVLYPKKFISTIHDVTPLTFKTGKASTKNIVYYELKHYFYRIVLNNLISKSIKIITPTKTVKRQLGNLYGGRVTDKICQIYEGVNYQLLEAQENIDLRSKYCGKFAIYVGNFYPHKNVEGLVRAFAGINKNIKLILIGPNDYFATRLTGLIEELHQEGRIAFYHQPDFGDLIYFYKNAICLINPSFSEGFGLPIAEAAHYHLPVIASDLDVFHELLDDRGVFFDPENVNDMKNKIVSFLEKPAKFDLNQNLARLSFRKMAEETLEIYLQA